MSHKRYISLSRKDLICIQHYLALGEDKRPETLEAIFGELVASGASDFTIIVEEG